MDDSMEISSEHGHNIRDEDIDIDIDLTTGHVDENYVLEDAISHHTFDDDFRFQASTPGNDELMVDEDEDETYMNQNGNLIPHDSSQYMADESFAAANGPAPSYIEVDDEVQDADEFGGASAREAEVVWENKEASNGSTVGTDMHVQSQEESIILEDENLIDKVNMAEVKVASAPLANTDSRPIAPQDGRPKDPETSKPSKSPSDTISKPTDEATQHITSKDHLDTSASHEYGEELHSESEDVYPTEDLHVPSIPEISVLYHETEYALFSTSELDDPDSFFLSDTSILDNPISHFFKAIRDVIHEDLVDEDELCLSMGDLDIDVEETSTLIQDITLRHILNLYEELLRNDGVESPRPFCIQFGVRTNFSKRLANLAAGAAEGKGLAELVSWTELSTSPEALTGEAEDTHGGDEKKDEPKQDEFDDVEREHEHEHEHELELEQDNLHAQASALGTDSKSPKPAPTSPDKSTAEENHDLSIRTPPKVEALENVDKSGSNNYDEDDLIDYSDEEEMPDEQGGDNQVIYDKSQQESTDHPADHSPAKQSTTQSEARGVKDDREEEVKVEFENGVEYDEEDDGAYYPETDIHENGPEASTGNDAVSGEEHEGNGPLPETVHELKSDDKIQNIENGHEFLEDEIEYDDNHDAETRDLPKISDQDLGLEGSPDKFLEDGLAGNLELGSTPTPKNGISDRILESSAVTNEAPEDEIDYDDDDEPSVLKASEPVPTSEEIPVSLDGSGKRQRDIANLDEGTSMTSKEPKRRKS